MTRRSNMTITSFTRADARNLNQEAKQALQEVAKRHGLVVESGNTRYSGDRCTVRFDFRTVTSDGAPAERDWRRHCGAFNLKPEDFGRTVVRNGRRFKVVGIKPRATSWPVLAERDDGRRFKLPASALL